VDDASYRPRSKGKVEHWNKTWSRAPTDAYRRNWEATFGRRDCDSKQADTGHTDRNPDEKGEQS